MDKKANLPSKKLSRIFLIVGIVLIVVGVTLGVIAINEYQAARDDWWNNGGEMPHGVPFYGILGFILAGFFGVGSIFIGLIPVLAKLTAKLHSETMDYAGKDISEASVKTVEVATPAIKKTGEAVAPVVAEIVKEVKKTSTEEKSATPDKYCPYCGEGLDDEYKFCPKCGKEI